MNNFIELHLWDMDENKRNTPVLVNIGTIEQIMINCKAPTFIYFGAGDYLELLPERYAVTISDDADMNEFVGNYTIVEQKGNVYIIEVKGEQK